MKKRFSEEQIIRILQEGKTRPIEELSLYSGKWYPSNLAIF
jgi:hypothetical protein